MVDMFKRKRVGIVEKGDIGDPRWLRAGFRGRDYRARFVAFVNGETVIWSSFAVVNNFLVRQKDKR